ncbi:hypothetical protein PAP_08740 [Palaeococcus pacificus DY20341]|uniref:Cytochrome b5 heme-binding domain-containing protein n=1 Tax=Palaeococcus pacificus DY20341 TaxID=1343739 RepID=A0A075LZZ9_9EURY|nr:cytochrome b5-like heme/steroid binding domain-containing protein [Palaeococcus pacificus]AIF70128.1 hypothetical protein PAP_08740 [Palaeococcus pacificus DY20341]
MQREHRALVISGELLIFVTLLTLLSGFFTTKNFLVGKWISYSSAYRIHTIILPIIFIPLLYVHSLAGILIAIERVRALNKGTIRKTIVVIWTLIFMGLLVLYLAQPESISSENNSGSILAQTAASPSIDAEKEGIILTLEEVSKHNQSNDCWIIVENKIYNVTSFLNIHPGGEDAIIPYCGTNATEVFFSKHDQGAYETLQQYYIGRIGDIIKR